MTHRLNDPGDLFLEPSSRPAQTERFPVRDQQAQVESGPVIVDAHVPLNGERAVEAFLEYMHLWWPATLRACGPDSHLGLEEGYLVEEGFHGGSHRWARITVVEDSGFALEWAGAPSSRDGGLAAAVSIAFVPEGDAATTVTAQVGGAPTSGQDWKRVMEAYARFAGGSLRS